jgi:hypothetical protein
MRGRTARLHPWLVVLVAAVVSTACNGMATPAPIPPLSTVRAVAILRSERPVNGKEKVFHAPLTGYSVVAVRGDGTRLTAAIDHSGVAVLSLPAGRYVLTTTQKGDCPPATVRLTAGERRTVNLHCVAP